MTHPNDPNAKSDFTSQRLTNDFLKELSSEHFQQPRLSLYQPTHRHHPENQQDPIRFRGLVKELERLLLANHESSEAKGLLEPFEALGEDAERFFRAMDRGVMERYSQPSGLPLILAALPEHHHVFHAVSHNPSLVSEGIPTHPDSISLDSLRESAWAVFEPLHQARLAALGEDFAVAKSKNLGMDDLPLISEAVAAGRVATLLIEADREIIGHIHAGSGNLHLGTTDHTQNDDLLDDLGERVLKYGGQVFVVPTAQMPTTTGAAATCRY